MSIQIRNVLTNELANNDLPVLSIATFKKFQKMIFTSAGITMSDGKITLVTGRLGKRLRALALDSFEDYLKYITKGPGSSNGEYQKFIDSLTTNETYFFREPQPYEFLKQQMFDKLNRGSIFKVWSAASSSGEEAYTLAMILAENFGIGAQWEIIGTDISSRMIKAANRAIYNTHRTKNVPDNLRRRYLLKGTGSQAGNFAVVPELKKHVRFEHYNLVSSTPRNELFDLIFCRNVLIYFSNDTKKLVVERLAGQMKSSSYLITGQSESLHGMVPQLRSVKPSIYCKTAGDL